MWRSVGIYELLSTLRHTRLPGDCPRTVLEPSSGNVYFRRFLPCDRRREAASFRVWPTVSDDGDTGSSASNPVGGDARTFPCVAALRDRGDDRIGLCGAPRAGPAEQRLRQAHDPPHDARVRGARTHEIGAGRHAASVLQRDERLADQHHRTCESTFRTPQSRVVHARTHRSPAAVRPTPHHRMGAGP
jgi:hypothetical protein